MDEELFELCKEVYKRFPEWEEEQGFYLYQIVGEDAINKSLWFNTLSFKFDDKRKVIKAPFYTSDYLLEKLSKLARTVYITQGKNWVDGKTVGVWANAQYGDSVSAGDKGDTPLKALLKLVIALADAGVKL
uniref:hypothetical protein n=1 Tax=Rhodococcus qingshengii TaxID=334542 RepID=UPI001C4E01CC|nr:hypothetical protein [Rhodococcus qingshengii]